MGIYEKIYDLQVSLDEMEWYKDKRNDYSEYKYVSEYVYKTNWRKALIDNRLIFQMDEVDREINFTYQTGAKQHHTIIKYEATLTDVDTGEFHVYVFSGEGSDGLDKGGAKAYTQGLKTFISTNFAISGNVNDEDNSGQAVIQAIDATPKELQDLLNDFGKLKADATNLESDTLLKDVVTLIKDTSKESDSFKSLKASRLKEIREVMDKLQTKIKNSKEKIKWLN